MFLKTLFLNGSLSFFLYKMLYAKYNFEYSLVSYHQPIYIFCLKMLENYVTKISLNFIKPLIIY